MPKKGVDSDMNADRNLWKSNTCCAEPRQGQDQADDDAKKYIKT